MAHAASLAGCRAYRHTPAGRACAARRAGGGYRALAARTPYSRRGVGAYRHTPGVVPTHVYHRPRLCPARPAPRARTPSAAPMPRAPCAAPTNRTAPQPSASAAHQAARARPTTVGIRHASCITHHRRDRRAYGDTPLQPPLVPSWVRGRPPGARRITARRPAFAPVAHVIFQAGCRGVSPYARRWPHARLPSTAPMPRAAPTNRTAPNRGRIAIRPYTRAWSIHRHTGNPGMRGHSAICLRLHVGFRRIQARGRAIVELHHRQ